jgi:hypothetical protein
MAVVVIAGYQFCVAATGAKKNDSGYKHKPADDKGKTCGELHCFSVYGE